MKSKYSNKRVSLDGYTFDSQFEAEGYLVNRMRERSGAISELEVHPVFELQPRFRDVYGKHHRAIMYEADFAYVEQGDYVVEDYKGFATPLFKLKLKLLLYRYPTFDVRIIYKERKSGYHSRRIPKAA